MIGGGLRSVAWGSAITLDSTSVMALQTDFLTSIESSANAELVSAPRRKGDNLVTGAKRVYKLVALRDIELRGEVFVCYGEYFDRGTPPYATSCTCCA